MTANTANLAVPVYKLMDCMKSRNAESGERKFFNDPKGRDKYAKQHGTYEHGRRLEDAKGILGITIGRNYYSYSALGAMANGIQLDSSEKYESLENAYRIKIVINYNCGPYQQHNEFNSLTR